MRHHDAQGRRPLGAAPAGRASRHRRFGQTQFERLFDVCGRRIVLAVAFLGAGAIVLVPLGPSAAQASPGIGIVYGDGSIATSEPECAAGDLCATLTSPDGTRLGIYNEGAGHCQPYTVRFVKMQGQTRLFDFSRRTEMFVNANGLGPPCAFGNTTFTLDNGHAHLLFFQNADGSLTARWGGGSPKILTPTGAVAPTPAAPCTIQTGPSEWLTLAGSDPRCATPSHSPAPAATPARGASIRASLWAMAMPPAPIGTRSRRDP